MPLTELEAVNDMLASIGESPVSTLQDHGVVDAVFARSTLQKISKEVQAEGWFFNREQGVTLTPTYPDQEIYLPETALSLTFLDPPVVGAYVQRGLRLYNRTTQSYKFTHPITVSLILELPFAELPEQAKTYIQQRATRIFQERSLGSAELSRLTVQDEASSLAALKSLEADQTRSSLLSSADLSYVTQRGW